MVGSNKSVENLKNKLFEEATTTTTTIPVLRADYISENLEAC